ncbi:hypothetical protein EDB83DRAFT_378225 [Lactarius deliciosus]|nr:hypothetical protein EDB83DRAFT_378225 [Lactarius deliciosus]
MPKIKNKGVKYDVTTTERCPLCEEDIQVGTAGPQGLAQHRGKKKCLATVKKKRQDAEMAKKPTLFSYLRRQDPTLPTTIDLAREAERREIERSSRVVVSQAVSLPVTNVARQDTQGQGQDADPSAGQHIDLDPDPDLDRDERLAWSTSKVRTRAGEREPRCEPWARNATPNLVPNNQANGVPHETNNTRQQPPATPARKGCRAAWLLLDQLRAEIARFRCETLERGGNELSNELSGYDRSAALSVCTDVPQDEVWENVNPGLDRILGFGRSREEIAAMVRCSWVGLRGLYEYLEVLVEEGGVVGGLLEGKVTALITA